MPPGQVWSADLAASDGETRAHRRSEDSGAPGENTLYRCARSARRSASLRTVITPI
jgi:hypothetical protein